MKVINFAHWSRSGITSLIKTIIENTNNFDHYFILLNDDKDFVNFYSYAHNKHQLEFANSKFKAVLSFRKLLREIQPDIVHAHSFMPLLLSVLFTKRTTRVIYHIHCDYPYLTDKGIKYSIKRWLIKWALDHRNTTNIAVSESAAEAIRKISNKECLYIANGIKDIGTERKPFTKESNKFRFYSVSRLDQEKNIGYAITLIDALKKRGIHASYDIYGNGAEKESLQSQIELLGLQECVKLKGFHNKPENLPSEYDFYLSTSRQEGLSLSALHSLRGKTPLITTPVGQIGAVLNHKISGFILNGNFVSDLETMIALEKLPSVEIEEIQTIARNLYLDNFQTSSFVKNISTIYSD